MDEQRAAYEALDLLDEVGGEYDRLVRLHDAEQDLVEVLAVEHVVAGEGFVHEDVVRALAEREHDLELVFLPRGQL